MPSDRNLMLDDRTGSIELQPYLAAHHLPVQVCRLQYGDLAFPGNGPNGPLLVGIERKRLTDLIDSKRSGRLAGHQLPGLLRDYEVVYLVIEGIWRIGRDSGAIEVPRHGGWQPLALGRKGFSCAELEGFLCGLENRCNIKIRKTSNEHDTAQLVHSLWTWWGSSWDNHKSLDVTYTPPPPVVQLVKPGIVHRVAAEIEGFGWDKAKAVAGEFRTVREMVDADEKRWAGIDGVGKTLARRAVKSLNEGA
jgi:ERCC4-type nuclease